MSPTYFLFLIYETRTQTVEIVNTLPKFKSYFLKTVERLSFYFVKKGGEQ